MGRPGVKKRQPVAELMLRAGEEAPEARHELLRKLAAAQEEERVRISRELHDGVGQSLTSVLVRLRALEGAHDPATVRAQLQALRAVASNALAEVQRIARGLRPAHLDHLGLDAAIRYLADEHRNHGMEIHVHATELATGRLPPSVETALYRIVQEALTNITKHAFATRVIVVVERDADGVNLVVEDNGRGFDTPMETTSKRGLGLHGIRERVALLDGTLRIESTRGVRTALHVNVPLPEPDR